MPNLTQTLAKAQCERLLAAVRRLRGSPAYNMEVEACSNRRRAFIAEMTGSSGPTNAVSLSSTVHGTGGIDLSDLPLLPTRKRRKRLRELVGSTVDDLQPPKTPVVTPMKRTKARKVTAVDFRPTLKP
jgi:hypothetical protein